MMKIPEEIIRPNIGIEKDRFFHVAPGTPFRSILKSIKRGQDICITGTYGFAMSFYAWLKKEVNDRIPIQDYFSSRKNRNLLHVYQSRTWIGVRNYVPELDKAPGNRWLKDFFPDQDHFYITFADYLGMNGARQWYERGIKYPVLDYLIHPFYGVYFPTRHDHLHLFDDWLNDNNRFERAIDIGTGCGVLSFMMNKHGIENVHATDINPNAIYGLQLESERLDKKMSGNINPEQASFLGSFQPGPDDLVVFNPPWIPEKPNKTMDKATFFDEGFFDDYFDEMVQKCPAGTTLLTIFSNYAMVVGLLEKNPVIEAIRERQDSFDLVSHVRAAVSQSPSRKKSWLQTIRSLEQLELFEVKRK